eukprot:6213582-Pleurochrysis_carterae.AAC.1
MSGVVPCGAIPLFQNVSSNSCAALSSQACDPNTLATCDCLAIDASLAEVRVHRGVARYCSDASFRQPTLDNPPS